MKPAFTLFCLALCATAFTSVGFAQDAHTSVALRSTDDTTRAAEPEFRFILFYKVDNAKTQQLSNELSTILANHADRAAWSLVNVADPQSQMLVNRFQLNRAPMPLVLCVAKNGAVTQVMMGKVTEKQVDAALVTPTMTRCMKQLQAGKIVVVHLKSDESQALPAGASEFMADPSFQNRTATESLVTSDPAETRFLKDMEVDLAQASGTSVIVIAPPGALVGKFADTATAADIAAKLHAAGKCCNDPNCKHNKGK
jgi:hypothetical protein